MPKKLNIMAPNIISSLFSGAIKYIAQIADISIKIVPSSVAFSGFFFKTKSWSEISKTAINAIQTIVIFEIGFTSDNNKLEINNVNVGAKRESSFSNFCFINYFFLKMVMMFDIAKMMKTLHSMIIAIGGVW